MILQVKFLCDKKLMTNRMLQRLLSEYKLDDLIRDFRYHDITSVEDLENITVDELIELKYKTPLTLGKKAKIRRMIKDIKRNLDTFGISRLPHTNVVPYNDSTFICGVHP